MIYTIPPGDRDDGARTICLMVNNCDKEDPCITATCMKK